MSRDKSKDNQIFDISNGWDTDYISELYGTDRHKIYSYLIDELNKGFLFRRERTFLDIYQNINDELGLPIPE